MENNLNFKSLIKVIFECGISVVCISLIFGLIYGLYTLISLNWNEYIFPTIISPIFLIISNIILFISNNLKIFTLGVVLINIWISCINSKISERFKDLPSILSNLSIFSILILFGLLPSNFIKGNFLISFIIFIFLIIFIMMHSTSLEKIQDYNEKIKKEENKLNEDYKQLSFDF